MRLRNGDKLPIPEGNIGAVGNLMRWSRHGLAENLGKSNKGVTVVLKIEYQVLGTATPTRHPSTDAAAAFDNMSANHSALYRVCLFFEKASLQLSPAPFTEIRSPADSESVRSVQ